MSHEHDQSIYDEIYAEISGVEDLEGIQWRHVLWALLSLPFVAWRERRRR